MSDWYENSWLHSRRQTPVIGTNIDGFVRPVVPGDFVSPLRNLYVAISLKNVPIVGCG